MIILSQPSKTAMQDERLHRWDLYFENISIFKNSAAYIGVVGKTAMKEKYNWQTMPFILIWTYFTNMYLDKWINSTHLYQHSTHWLYTLYRTLPGQTVQNINSIHCTHSLYTLTVHIVHNIIWTDSTHWLYTLYKTLSG